MPFPHGHCGWSAILKRWRYLFSEQCPVLSLASHASSWRLRFVMFEYNLGPLSPVGLCVIARRCCPPSFPSLHSFSHLALVLLWIAVFLADFIAECVNGVASWPFDCAAFFASQSACSLPGMSSWPGVQTIDIANPGRCCCSSSMASRMLRIIDCPDCCPGLTIAVIAAWLSVYRTHLVYSGLSLTISVASLMAHNSAAYTLYEVSFPRYW